MPNELTLLFSPDDVQTLLDENPDKIVVRVYLEEVTLNNNAKAGALRVKADAHQNNTPQPLATIDGCPIPPCSLDE